MTAPPRDTLLHHRVRPGTPHPEGALILFHGRGADENDLYPLLDMLDQERRLLGITPRGPLGLPPGGAHWYVVREVGYPDPETFHPTFRLASAWLDVLAEKSGISPQRIVLGGFSQGAVMSYALGLAAGRPRPAGIIALSGFIPTVEGFTVDVDRPLPPVAIGHGARDPVITVDHGRQARDLLERSGASVLYREAPLPHTVDPTFLVQLVPWIRRLFEGAPPPPG